MTNLILMLLSYLSTPAYPNTMLAPPPINFTTEHIQIKGRIYDVEYDGKRVTISDGTTKGNIRLFLYRMVQYSFVWTTAISFWVLLILAIMGKWNAFKGVLGAAIILFIIGIKVLDWPEEE